MPLVEIHLLEGRTKKQKKALLQAVTEAIQASLGSPLPTIRIWLKEFPADEYMVGGDLASERKKL